MFDSKLSLSQIDPDVAAAISAENARQEAHIELIASENYASPAVMAAQGSQLSSSPTNMLKAIRVSGITAAANMWMLSNNWRLSV